MEDSVKKLYDWQLLDTVACSLHLGCPLGSAELLKHRLQGWLRLQGSPSLGTHRVQVLNADGKSLRLSGRVGLATPGAV